MPFVTDFADGARFTVRVRSSLTSNRRVRWHNTYEYRASEAGDISAIQTLALNTAGFQVAMCYNYVTIDEVTVSSWEPDSHPYNPLGFATYVVNNVGSVPLGTETPVSLRQTLFVKRVVLSGLQGKLFLRGALSNDDLAYSDGEWQLSDPSGMESDLNTAITSSFIEQYMQGIESDHFYMCMLGDGGETRYIDDFAVGGTSDVKMNHKYYDRS